MEQTEISPLLHDLLSSIDLNGNEKNITTKNSTTQQYRRKPPSLPSKKKPPIPKRAKPFRSPNSSPNRSPKQIQRKQNHLKPPSSTAPKLSRSSRKPSYMTRTSTIQQKPNILLNVQRTSAPTFTKTNQRPKSPIKPPPRITRSKSPVRTPKIPITKSNSYATQICKPKSPIISKKTNTQLPVAPRPKSPISQPVTLQSNISHSTDSLFKPRVSPQQTTSNNFSYVAFGVRRAQCTVSTCDCKQYITIGAGGPCQNCGHFPAKHSKYNPSGTLKSSNFSPPNLPSGNIPTPNLPPPNLPPPNLPPPNLPPPNLPPPNLPPPNLPSRNPPTPKLPPNLPSKQSTVQTTSPVQPKKPVENKRVVVSNPTSVRHNTKLNISQPTNVKKGDTSKLRRVAASQHTIDDEHILSLDCKFKLSYLTTSNTLPRVKSVKAFFIGDERSGKTSLINALLNKPFDPNYKATVFDTHKTEVAIPGLKKMPTEYWDCSGSLKYDKKRPVIYPNVNCFVLCIDLTSNVCWTNAKKRWIPEIYALTRYPVLIVGTKYDAIGAHNAHQCVNVGDVMAYCESHCSNFKVCRFFATSASSRHGVDGLSEAIIYSTLYNPSFQITKETAPSDFLRNASNSASVTYKKLKKELKRKVW